MSYETLLIAVLALPFAGSCIAALLKANARNAEAWLAGAAALGGLALTGAAYPRVVGGGVIRIALDWVPDLGLDFTLLHITPTCIGIGFWSYWRSERCTISGPPQLFVRFSCGGKPRHGIAVNLPQPARR